MNSKSEATETAAFLNSLKSWRSSYADLSENIRRTKRAIRDSKLDQHLRARAQQEKPGLRGDARAMMVDREDLAEKGRAHAASRPKVSAA